MLNRLREPLQFIAHPHDIVDQTANFTERIDNHAVAVADQPGRAIGDMTDFGRSVVRLALQCPQMGDTAPQRFQPAMIVLDALIDLRNETGDVAALQCESPALFAKPRKMFVSSRHQQ